MHFSFIFILFLCLILGQSRKLKTVLSLQRLKASTNTVLLAKFDIDAGEGSFDVRYKKVRVDSDENFKKLSLKLGIMDEEAYAKTSTLKQCKQIQTFFYQNFSIFFMDSFRGQKKFVINSESQKIWYLMLFDCEAEVEKNSLVGKIQFDITMLNNGNHLGADEEYFVYGYICMMILWVLMVATHFKPVLKSIDNSNQMTRLFIFGGFVFLGLAYLYRFLDVILTSLNGEGVLFLKVLYQCIKYIVEGIVNCVLISIAWGWSIVHLQHEPYYIIMGAVTTLASIIATIVDSMEDKIDEGHHSYDNTRGFILLIIRLLMIILFVIGILRSLTTSAGRIKYFLKQFAKEGCLFLISWPAAYLLAQMFLPVYMRREFIIVVDEFSHILACGYMCRLFAMPNSDYIKVNMKKQDEIIPDRI